MSDVVRLGTLGRSPRVETAGVLAGADLEVREVPASSPAALFADLVTGALDAVLTSPDTVRTHRRDQDRTVDVRIVAVVDGETILTAYGPAIDADVGRLTALTRVLVPDGTAFVLNGRPVRIGLDAETSLIYVLRNDLDLRGTRFGCGTGQCGACMVLVDGHPTPSCDLPVWAVADKMVVTVEGLGDPHPLQTAFLDEQAAQCGYCVSGILVNAAGLLARDPDPSEEAVRAQLDRNLCRCGVHNRVVRAVLRAAESA